MKKNSVKNSVKNLFLLGGVFSGFSVMSAVCPGDISTDVFDYSGSIVTYTVPVGATELRIVVSGAEGGNNIAGGSTVTPGLGAQIEGDFLVNSGDQFQLLVGEQPSLTTGGGNGGGGGSFVTDMLNNPVIIAGGGSGSSETTDSVDKHGQAGTAGGTGSAGGGLGGTAGSGGNAGASGFQSGAGGGLLTDGQDGWTTDTGGDAFINGGAGATNNGLARGGFGGGGSGSSNVVGGGGGGYSGGGSGGNSTGGVGGGGGSFNSGSNQTNTAGIRVGHGQIQICASSGITADLSVVKDLTSTGPYNVGDSVTYSITVANAGPDAASNIVVSDTMTNLTLVSLSGGTCAPASFPCTIPSIASGGSEILTVTASIAALGMFDNSVTVTAAEFDSNLANNTDDTGNDGATAVVDLSVVKDLTSTGPYNVGDSVTYSITVANAGPDAASNVVVSDTMTNLTLVSLSGGSCAPASFPCTIPSIANGGSEVLTVTASITAEGVFDNSVTVTAAEFDSFLVNNTDFTGNDGATAVVDLSVVKNLTSTGPYNVGDSVTYSITVANAGPDAASNVVVSDTMTNLTLVSLSGGSCAPASFPCTIPSIANGGSEVLTVTTSIAANGMFDNSVTVTAAEFDSNLANNTDDTGNDGATAVVDLSVVKDLTSTGPYNVGDSVTYSITVANAGPDAASNVVVSDTMTNLTLVSLSGGSCAPASFPCTIPSIANGGSEVLTVTASITAEGVFDNSVTVTAAEFDSNTGNNTDDTGNDGATTAVDLSVVKNLTSTGPYNVGDTVTYSIIVANAGPDAASNVVVSDTMTNLTLVSLSGGSCAPASFPCTIPFLANGGSETLTVTATIPTSGAFDNSASVAYSGFDINPSNNIDDTGNNGITGSIEPQVVPTIGFLGVLLLMLMLVFFANRYRLV